MGPDVCFQDMDAHEFSAGRTGHEDSRLALRPGSSTVAEVNVKLSNNELSEVPCTLLLACLPWTLRIDTMFVLLFSFATQPDA